ncbi:MAG TPA: uroporphyrinogen-III synthase, partial [Stellaceae bacterium]|nr:uroporphyrinogen-III synthase [Stellaceae bacterium]
DSGAPPRYALRAIATRPRAEAEGLATALAARGIDTIIEPMLEIRCFAGPPPDIAGVRAVLCTSANGVRAFARACPERAVPLFAVGEATAARAHAEGFAHVESAGGAVGDLARLVVERLDPRAGRLLHCTGNAVAGNLAGELGAAGFSVERAVLYEARPAAALSRTTAAALAAGCIDVALFFSPRTAAIFVRLAAAAGLAAAMRRVAAISISAAADAALTPLIFGERHIARRPDQAGILAALDPMIAARCGR